MQGLCSTSHLLALPARMPLAGIVSGEESSRCTTMLPEAAFCKLLGAEESLLPMPWLPMDFSSFSSFPAEHLLMAQAGDISL